MAGEKLTKADFDMCACGDYRKDHRDGTGPCAFNHIPGNVHGHSQCMQFRLFREAADIPLPYETPGRPVPPRGSGP